VTTTPVLQIARIVLNVADLEGACAFYTDALGFRRLAISAQPSAQLAVLRLGQQELELRVSGGRPYPQPRAANDPWFQHFAIAVADMDRAYRRLTHFSHEPISQSGPQLLPPSTGSVTAYKFRDPEGHPLELSYIPQSDWLSQKRPDDNSPFLGIDHSAMAVRDLDASLAFYAGLLNLTETGRWLNQGPQQALLDDLPGARLDIVAMQTQLAGPHIELLHYRSPISGAAPEPIGPLDVSASRLILRVAGLDVVKARLGSAGSPSACGAGLATQDPDGHWLEFIQPE